MKVAVVRFPGSNCDADALHAAELAGHEAFFVWHRSADLLGAEVVILPGGFSYGDHLRPGAIARFSPVMQSVAAHARAGGYLLGICNGFQILCEAHLLPGQLVRNERLAFVCKPVTLKVESDQTLFTSRYKVGATLRLPVAHGDGRYVADEATLDMLERDGRVVFRYVGGSPNGAMREIAGIRNAEGNVVGMMPHPERAVEPILGSTDGLAMFALAGVTAGVS